MDEGKKKWKAHLDGAEAAKMLRSLADDIESGHFSIFESQLDIAPEADFKISLKQNEGKQSLECKFEYHGRRKEGGSGDSTGGEEYDDLKDRMKSDFKTLKEAVAATTLPGSKTAERFIRDSRIMCTYPGMGDPYYPEYLSVVDQFAQALAQEDVAAVSTAVTELERLKRECHDRYK